MTVLAWSVTGSAEYIDFIDLGLTDITDVWLPDMPEEEMITENMTLDKTFAYTFSDGTSIIENEGDKELSSVELVDIPNRFVLTRKRKPEASYNIYVGGKAVANETVVSPDVGVFVLPDTNATNATIRYVAKNYTVSHSSEGTIDRITTVPENFRPGTYLVVCTKRLRVWHPADDETSFDRRTIEQITRSISQAVPVTVGSVTWSGGTSWFDDDDPAPTISHAPVPLDGGATN
jgi:hypothetical protein